MTTVTT